MACSVHPGRRSVGMSAFKLTFISEWNQSQQPMVQDLRITPIVAIELVGHALLASGGLHSGPVSYFKLAYGAALHLVSVIPMWPLLLRCLLGMLHVQVRIGVRIVGYVLRRQTTHQMETQIINLNPCNFAWFLQYTDAAPQIGATCVIFFFSSPVITYADIGILSYCRRFDAPFATTHIPSIPVGRMKCNPPCAPLSRPCIYREKAYRSMTAQ